jgi:hypothetical protein
LSSHRLLRILHAPSIQSSLTAYMSPNNIGYCNPRYSKLPNCMGLSSATTPELPISFPQASDDTTKILRQNSLSVVWGLHCSPPQIAFCASETREQTRCASSRATCLSIHPAFVLWTDASRPISVSLSSKNMKRCYAAISLLYAVWNSLNFHMKMLHRIDTRSADTKEYTLVREQLHNLHCCDVLFLIPFYLQALQIL